MIETLNTYGIFFSKIKKKCFKTFVGDCSFVNFPLDKYQFPS